LFEINVFKKINRWQPHNKHMESHIKNCPNLPIREFSKQNFDRAELIRIFQENRINSSK